MITVIDAYGDGKFYKKIIPKNSDDILVPEKEEKLDDKIDESCALQSSRKKRHNSIKLRNRVEDYLIRLKVLIFYKKPNHIKLVSIVQGSRRTYIQ